MCPIRILSDAGDAARLEKTAVDTGISLQTGDIDAYHAQLKDRGVDVDAEVGRFGDAVPPLFWFRDPEGNTLMVVEAR